MTTSDGALVGTTKVVDHGPASRRFNLVVFGDGYQAAQLAQYADDVDRLVNVLFATAPFTEVQSAINVYRVDVTSTDSGADEPAACGGSGATVRTYFDASFCNFGSPRLLLVDNGTVITTANAEIPEWTMLIVIVNSPVYGGAGGQVATFSLAPEAGEIALHEIGHTAFGLADEYEYFRGCGLESDRDHHPGSEPFEANITTNTDQATLKWRHLVVASTAVPTTRNPDCTRCDPQASPVPAGTVGLFEGAHYFHCDAFRPEFTCRMRALNSSFCAVCQERILAVMAAYMGPTLPTLPTLQRGDAGQAVRNLQGLLLAHGVDPGGIDGIFGPATEAAVLDFQQRSAIAVDGIVGPQTWGALLSAGLPTLQRGDAGQAVRNLQGLLLAHGLDPRGIDGIFGAATEAAVLDFQQRSAIAVDGIVGPQTWGALLSAGLPTLQRGDAGQAVRNLQGLLLAHGLDPRGIDGIFGAATEAAVLDFQQRSAIAVDGIVGPQTWGALLSAGLPTLQRGDAGQAVRNLQGLLLAHGVDPRGIDGIFGPATEAAVLDFQQRSAIAVDGIVGPQTWGALLS